MKHAVCGLALFSCLIVGPVFAQAMVSGNTVTLDKKTNPEHARQLSAIYPKVQAGKFKEAVADADRLLAVINQTYADGSTFYFSSQSEMQQLMSLVTFANSLRDGKVGAYKQAQDTGPVWSGVLFLKAYSLAELKNIAGARAAINEAVSRAPWSSHFLNESGEIAKRDRKWVDALMYFRDAEAKVEFTDTAYQAAVKSRALRGQAYALIELGRLAEAESILNTAINNDPNDQGARQELEYLRSKH